MNYQKHFFICTNQKENGEGCAQYHTKDICKNLKQIFRDQGNGDIAMRINQSGCLGECSKGPVMVVYPQGDWYQFFDQDDVHQIIQTHINSVHAVTNSEDSKILLNTLDAFKLAE
jgi:(2Fe-2S) ferredoxin